MNTNEKKKIIVWTDGCFDMMHYGHANALRQVNYLRLSPVLKITKITKKKGKSIRRLFGCWCSQ